MVLMGMDGRGIDCNEINKMSEWDGWKVKLVKKGKEGFKTALGCAVSG